MSTMSTLPTDRYIHPYLRDNPCHLSSPDLERLLADYLNARIDFFKLAQTYSLSVDQLRQTLDSQPFQTLLKAHERLAKDRAAAIALSAIPIALDRLAEILAGRLAGTGELRRAASTLLRESRALLKHAPQPQGLKVSSRGQSKAQPSAAPGPLPS